MLLVTVSVWRGGDGVTLGSLVCDSHTSKCLLGADESRDEFGGVYSLR